MEATNEHEQDIMNVNQLYSYFRGQYDLESIFTVYTMFGYDFQYALQILKTQPKPLNIQRRPQTVQLSDYIEKAIQ